MDDKQFWAADSKVIGNTERTSVFILALSCDRNYLKYYKTDIVRYLTSYKSHCFWQFQDKHIFRLYSTSLDPETYKKDAGCFCKKANYQYTIVVKIPENKWTMCNRSKRTENCSNYWKTLVILQEQPTYSGI